MQIRNVFAMAILVIGLAGAGCIGADQSQQSPTDTTVETTVETTISPSERLSYRLIIVPDTPSNATTRVTITNVTGSGQPVFDESLTLNQTHNLDQYFKPGSRYRVRLQTNESEKTIGIGEYSGYKIFMNESGVVFVEAEMI